VVEEPKITRYLNPPVAIIAEIKINMIDASDAKNVSKPAAMGTKMAWE